VHEKGKLPGLSLRKQGDECKDKKKKHVTHVCPRVQRNFGINPRKEEVNRGLVVGRKSLEKVNYCMELRLKTEEAIRL